MKIDRDTITKHWPHLAVFAASLITILIWYRHGGLLFYADSTWPIGNPFAHAYDFSYGWKSQLSGGIIDATGYAIVPFFILIGILQGIGFSPILAQAIFFLGILSLTGSGALVLLKYLGETYKLPQKPFAILIPALFYMSNLYIAINGWRMIIFAYLFNAALPWLIWLFLKYLDTERTKYIWAFALFTTAFVSTALTNLSFLFILLGVMAAVSCLYLRRKGPARWLGLQIKALIIWIPLNLWYLLPQFFNVSDSTSKSTGGGNLAGSFSILNVVSSHASFLNVLSLNGYLSLYDTIGGHWFKWAGAFTSSPIALLSFVFPVLLIGVAINKKLLTRAPALVILSLLLVLVGAFFAKGSHDPFGGIFIYLFKHFPVPFLAFRAAYEKLGLVVVLGYLLIVYLFLTSPLPRLERYQNWLTMGLLGTVLILGFPVWTGTIFDSNNGIRTSAHITIPGDYQTVASLLKQDPHALTLSLPMQHTTWISSKWNNGSDGYIGNDILRLLSHTPIISTDIGSTVIDNFNHKVEKDFTPTGVDITDLVSRQIKYVVVRKDINYQWGAAYGFTLAQIADLKSGIEASGHFQKKFESSNLILYELTSPKPRSYITAVDKLFSFDVTRQLKSFNDFIAGTFQSDYIFTDTTTKIPSNKITSLYANLASTDVDTTDATIVEKIGHQYDLGSILYKTANPSVIRSTVRSGKMSFSAEETGSLQVNGAGVLPNDPSLYPISSLAQAPNTKYFLHANNEYVALPTAGTIETPNRAGDTQLDLVATSTSNLVSNGDFSAGTWTPKVDDCAKSNPDSQMSMTIVTPQGVSVGKALSLTATNHIACTHEKITVPSGGQYILSFDYMSPTRSRAGYAVEGATGKDLNLTWSTRLADTSWHHYSQLITIPPGQGSVSVFLYAYATNGFAPNTTLYTNASLFQVANRQTVSPATSSKAVSTAASIPPGTNITYTGLKTDFEQTNVAGWSEPVQDCGATDDNPQISLQVSKDSGGEDVVKLASQSHIACTTTDLPMLAGAHYILSFHYQATSTSAAGYYIKFNNSSQTVITEHLAAKSPATSNAANIHFIAPLGATVATVYLYAFEPADVSKNVATYSHIQLTRVPDVEGKFYLVSPSSVATAAPQNLSFSTPNPVTRRITITKATKPFYLTMSENYSSNWRLEIRNAKTKGFGSWWPWTHPDAIPASDHFDLNGFENGWYVDINALCVRQKLCTQNPDGSYNLEMTAEFAPQRWFYIGLAISVLTLAGYVCYRMLKRVIL